jgi:hypothetical protein
MNGFNVSVRADEIRPGDTLYHRSEYGPLLVTQNTRSFDVSILTFSNGEGMSLWSWWESPVLRHGVSVNLLSHGVPSVQEET